MTKHDLARELEELADQIRATSGDETTLAAPWVTYDAGVDPDPDADIRVKYELVMRRERAEEEGREILGPAEDAPEGVVRVAPEDDES